MISTATTPPPNFCGTWPSYKAESRLQLFLSQLFKEDCTPNMPHPACCTTSSHLFGSSRAIRIVSFLIVWHFPGRNPMCCLAVSMVCMQVMLIKQSETLEVRLTGPSMKVLPFIFALLFGLVDTLSFRTRAMPDYGQPINMISWH